MERLRGEVEWIMSCNGFCLWKVSLYGVSGGWVGGGGVCTWRFVGTLF